MSNLFYSPASSPHTFPSLGRRGKTPADHLELCGQSSLHINMFMSMREPLIAGFSTKGTLILASTVLQCGTLPRSTSMCDFLIFTYCDVTCSSICHNYDRLHSSSALTVLNYHMSRLTVLKYCVSRLAELDYHASRLTVLNYHASILTVLD